ncbi:MAG: HK97 family phage prohead protease [Caulobacter sp.]|nr:HK97 family phage prohead protease [Caulobacter sp.]
MDRLSIPFEIKLATSEPTGTVEGYGSVFDVRDSHGDVVARGAFNASLEQRRREGRALPPMYMNHGSMMGADARPVGVWLDMAEDDHGLRVKGRLSGLDTDAGRFNLALIRDGAMRGLSIGYRVAPGGAVAGRSETEPRRVLNRIDLFEVSIVDDPANASALITNLKGRASACASIRDFEGVLQEIGFAKAAARKIASGGWAALNHPEHQSEIEGLARHIAAAAAELKGVRA